MSYYAVLAAFDIYCLTFFNNPPHIIDEEFVQQI